MRQRASTSEIVELAVDGLAVYRLTRLVTADLITEPVRARIKIRSLPAFDFVTCPWCTSVWLAGAALAGRTFAPSFWDRLARLLSFSAVAGLISERG